MFLEAATPTEQKDVFRVYFGGADAVVGTAVIKVPVSTCLCSNLFQVTFEHHDKRPPPSQRLFVSPVVDNVITEIATKMVC